MAIPLNTQLPSVSQLSYGCMGLGGGWDSNPISQDDIAQAHRLIDTALDVSINHFDHADIYTLGKAEQVFGEVLKARPELREQIYLQSKCGIRFDDDKGPGRYDFSADWIQSSVDASLSRLGIEQLDVLLLHRPDPLMQPEEVAKVFARLKDAGKVRFFGVSNMQLHQIAFLQSYLPEPLVANQLELGLHKTDWLDEVVDVNHPDGVNSHFTPGTLEYCRTHGLQVQAWSSLARGMFSGRSIDDEPDKVKQTAHRVAELAAEYGVSREAIVLAFVTRHPAGIQPVIGTTSPERVRACADVERVTLTREHWYSLFVAARGRRVP